MRPIQNAVGHNRRAQVNGHKQKRIDRIVDLFLAGIPPRKVIFLREIVIDLEVALIDIEWAARREGIVVDDAGAGEGSD